MFTAGSSVRISLKLKGGSILLEWEQTHVRQAGKQADWLARDVKISACKQKSGIIHILGEKQKT